VKDEVTHQEHCPSGAAGTGARRTKPKENGRRRLAFRIRKGTLLAR